MEPEAPETEGEILRRGAAMLAERLPAGWSSRLIGMARRGTDARCEIRDQTGSSAVLVVTAKRVVNGRDVDPLRDQLEALAQQAPEGQGLVIARYLSAPVRAKLTEAGISYIDATGNMRVEVESPGLFLSDRGADRDPWRGPGRPRGTLQGEPAAKIVRAIADFARDWSVRELVDVAKTSTGATYRVVEFLEREGLAMRDENSRITVEDWSQLLRRWSDDYGYVRGNQVTRWIAPRGLPSLVDRIGATGARAVDRSGYGGGPAPGAGANDGTGDGSGFTALRYAVTGSIAAAEWAAYAPARLAMIYVTDAAAAAEAWDLRPADAGANVMLAQPKYDVVFERSSTNNENVTVAAPSQVVVDLMTGPGRNPSEAEELLEWMKRNESSWRT